MVLELNYKEVQEVTQFFQQLHPQVVEVVVAVEALLILKELVVQVDQVVEVVVEMVVVK